MLTESVADEVVARAPDLRMVSAEEEGWDRRWRKKEANDDNDVQAGVCVCVRVYVCTTMVGSVSQRPAGWALSGTYLPKLDRRTSSDQATDQMPAL